MLPIKELVQALFYFPDDSPETLAYQLERHAARIPERTFLLYGDRRYSYFEANAAINRHAHAYQALGVGHGDVVALLMENRPEQLFHLFGLHKLGAVVSLVNTHLIGDLLHHAITVCEPKYVMIGSELWSRFAEVQPQLQSSIASNTYVDLDPERAELEDSGASFSHAQIFDALTGTDDSDPRPLRQPKLGDLAAYIYTSGTTGKPKAALVRHQRLHRAGAAWASLALRYRSSDVMYNCLPLYHANGLMLATGSAVVAGVTMALARRFSRTHFWDDVRKYRATSFIYIGELCRYLMNNEPSLCDREHAVRVITGNGLRPEIWPAFQKRFGIARVAEFYGATEGNCITINVANLTGSVGPMLPGMALAKWDEAAQDFVRDAQGFLCRTRAGEPGILLGRIRARQGFDGYRDARETERKVIRNAFRAGDAYFNAGDLLKRDWRRHLYFTDRVGDTFRWKGENVSTLEVQEEIAKWAGAVEANVYGVEVPGAEGRAGMVAIVVAGAAPFDPAAFKAHVDANLPSFARPLFVRLTSAMETTGTHKLKKNDLQQQAFNPTLTSDPIYFRHPNRNEYVRLDEALYAELTNGKLSL